MFAFLIKNDQFWVEQKFLKITFRLVTNYDEHVFLFIDKKMKQFIRNIFKALHKKDNHHCLMHIEPLAL